MDQKLVLGQKFLNQKFLNPGVPKINSNDKLPNILNRPCCHLRFLSLSQSDDLVNK